MERAWVEVDLGAIARNLMALRRKLGAKPRINAVVKANAYGHGAIMTARLLEAVGADGLAVATPGEALELRDAGLRCPITLLGPFDAADLPELAEADIAVTVIDEERAARVQELAPRLERPLTTHLKINTGMHRFGVAPSRAEALVEALLETPGVELASLATHFADAEDPQQTAEQLRIFDRARARLPSLPIQVANSMGCVLRDARDDDLVRPGLALYGIDPTASRCFAAHGVELSPALKVCSRVVSIRDVEPGERVGYGGTWRAGRPTRLALVPIGYGDGWAWRESNQGEALVAGGRAPIVGTVMMDCLALDITDLTVPVETGAEVVLIGRQGGRRLDAEDLAARIGTIPYEIPCRLGPRLPRRYIVPAGLKLAGPMFAAEAA